MNSLGIAICAAVLSLVLAGSRTWAALGILAAALFLPQQQALDILSFNITGVRIVEVAAIFRVIVDRRLLELAFNRVDAAVAAAYGYTCVVFLMRSSTGQAEVTGWAFDSLLSYFALRALIADLDDVVVVLKRFVLLLVPYVLLLALEARNGSNPFAALGTWTSWVELRDDRVRAMGSFRNPSLLGTLGACFLPLYLGMFLSGSGRVLAALGMLLCGAVLYLSNSGGPMLTAAAGLTGSLCWMVRRRMRVLRIGALAGLAGLSLVMQAPVWSLLERASSISGGSGWHRAHLLTMASANLDQWWLAGMPLSMTIDWFPYVLGITGTADITNAFVDAGLKGGLLALGLFVMLYVAAFGLLGRALAAVRAAGDGRSERLLWGLGCVLTVHAVTWFAITYFDQFYLVWFMQLAALASAAGACLAGRAAPKAAVADRRGARAHPHVFR